MKTIIPKIALISAFLFFTASIVRCESVTIDKFIKEYNQATDVQRAQLESSYRYNTISVSGTIANVEGWDIFDEKNQIKQRYYRVSTTPRQIDAGDSYATAVFYKDKASVENLKRGEQIQVDGILLKIVTTPGFFSIWVYSGDLNQEDKTMFEQ